MIIIAVDPGLTGAVGCVGPQGEFLAVWDLPVIRDASLAWINGVQFRQQLLDFTRAAPGGPYRFVVERVSAMPKQGVSGVFTFGVVFGSILGTLQAFEAPLEFVTPVVWKRDMGLSGKSKKPTEAKRAALDKARLLFPQADLSLAKHDGRAEALLLAHWATRHQSPAREAA